MKYELTIDVNLPVTKVVELFDSTENLYKWQPELQSFEHISGEPGEIGAKSKLVYLMNGSPCEMIETITKKALPDSFSGTYEAKGVWNQVDNRFEFINDNLTRWHVTNEFRFQGLMKIVGFLMPWMFKKQTQKYLEQFRTFAESQISD